MASPETTEAQEFLVAPPAESELAPLDDELTGKFLIKTKSKVEINLPNLNFKV